MQIRYSIIGNFTAKTKKKRKDYFFSGMFELNNENKTLKGRLKDGLGTSSIHGKMGGDTLEFRKKYDFGIEYIYKLRKKEKDSYTGIWMRENTKGIVECIVQNAPVNFQTTKILESLR